MSNNDYINIGNGTWVNGECIEIMSKIPDDSFDMILCDLPYGTTDNKWDSVIPLDALWDQYNRLAKPNSPIVLTATQPFVSQLVISNIKNYRCDWIWDKKAAGNPALAKYHPLRVHEHVLVFAKETANYYPQKVKGPLRRKGGKAGAKGKDNFSGLSESKDRYITNDEYYPKSIIDCSNGSRVGIIHPTQKPVELFEYLIKTYTNEYDIVLDNCAGSGTTAIAAENTNRRWACIEKDEKYSQDAIKRINEHIKEK